MRILTLVLATAGLTLLALAQPEPPTAWQQTYGTAQRDYATSLVQSADGGFMMAGCRNCSYNWSGGDVMIVKANSDGTELWRRTYGGTGADQAIMIQATADGGYVVAGATGSVPGRGVDVWVLRLNASGDTLWTRNYGGTATDAAWAVRPTPDGGFIVAGGTNSSGAGASDFWLLKLNAQGRLQWSQTYGTAQDDYAYDVVPTSDGGYALVGISYYYGLWESLLIKTDGSGVQQWSRRYRRGSRAIMNRMVETADGGFLLAGGGFYYFSTNDDACFIRTSATGDSLWGVHFGGPETEEARGVRQTADGGFIAVGFTDAYGSRDMWVLKLTAQGQLQWSQLYGGWEYERAFDVVELPGPAYGVLGQTGSWGAGDWDFYLVKTGADHWLPVALTAFDAVPAAGGIRVSFTVAAETDNARFEIWRSNRQGEGFERITELPSLGNTSSERRYEHLDREVTPGRTYWYYLVDVDLEGNRTEHRDRMRSASWTDAALPLEFALTAYPNPFNATTRLAIALPEAQPAQVTLYDVAGRRVATLFAGDLEAGRHEVSVGAADLATGVYLVHLDTPRYTRTFKLLLLK